MTGIVRDDMARRAADISIASSAMAILSPALAGIAIAIRLDSPGPVLFRQTRVGKHGAPFHILKFRTMVADAERTGPSISGAHDSRVTRIGRALRATKLDELPQLWNVLRGDMTLVGPRAEVPEMVEHYTDEELVVLASRPGLTGSGQLYFTTDQAVELDNVEDVERHYVAHQLHTKLAIDLEYLRTRTWRSDTLVIARTVRLMLRLGVRLLGLRRTTPRMISSPASDTNSSSSPLPVSAVS